MKLELRHTRGLSREASAVIEEINNLIAAGVDRFAEVIRRAASKYMQLEERDREKLRQHPNAATAKLAHDLERVHAHELHPRLALTNGWAARTLARLDYAAQESAIVNMLPVLLEDGSDHILKAFDELTRDEIQQVFDATASPPVIRDLQGQRAWQIAKKADERNKTRAAKRTGILIRAGRYRIEGAHFYPLKPQYTRKELETALADMIRLQS